MAREISPVCDFISSSICTSIQMDTVDVELMIRTVKGIYTIGKTIWQIHGVLTMEQDCNPFSFAMPENTSLPKQK